MDASPEGVEQESAFRERSPRVRLKVAPATHANA